jgi:hypothetical protein
VDSREDVALFTVSHTNHAEIKPDGTCRNEYGDGADLPHVCATVQKRALPLQLVIVAHAIEFRYNTIMACRTTTAHPKRAPTARPWKGSANNQDGLKDGVDEKALQNR